MNVLDLFSGIGGFSLGLERAGMRTVAFCESDDYCRAVLRKHWPSVSIVPNIKHLGPAEVEQLGRIDLVCGGFPCQPFSVAGDKRGKEDDRHLWPYMLRVIAYARPTWVVGENVAGIVTMVLDEVLADLEGLGYTARTFVIPACAVDAPHRRDRIWIVATNANRKQHKGRTSADEWTSTAELLGSNAEGDRREQGRTSSREGFRELGGLRDSGRIATDTDSGELRDESRRFGGTSRKGSPKPANDEWWTTEPDVGRVAHGIPRRVDRLRCLGNAVVPQVVEEIGRAIMSNRLMASCSK